MKRLQSLKRLPNSLVLVNQWLSITGEKELTLPNQGGLKLCLYGATGEERSLGEFYLANFSIIVKENNTGGEPGTPVTAYYGLTFPDKTTALQYTSFQGKSDVLKISPKESGGYDWAAAWYALTKYKGKEVEISVSMKAWIDESTKIMWQVNNSDYPVIAGGIEYSQTGQWISISGTKTITVADTGYPTLYINGGADLKDKTIYITDLVININNIN
jgi:hypothetical protein